MVIEKKEKYTLISADENTFSDFYTSFLENEKLLEKEHLIVQISPKISTKKEDFLLFLSKSGQKKQNGTSFVIINEIVNVDDFPDDFNIVPTLIEAEDIIDMEAMERELGF